MPHVFLSHVATVTATATIAYNNVDVHVDVTHLCQQTLASPACHDLSVNCLSTTLPQNWVSTPIHQKTYSSSPEISQDSNFSAALASTMSSSDTTAMCDPADLYYYSEQGSWCGGTNTDDNPYWQSQLLVGNNTNPEESGLYGSNVVSSFGNVAGCPGTHFMQGNNYQHSSYWTMPQLDCAPASMANSGWYQQGGASVVQQEGEAHYYQHREPSAQHDKQTEGIKYTDYDLDCGSDGYTAAPESVDAMCTDPQSFFTLTCLKSSDVSMSGTQGHSSTQNDIFHAINPFQENVLCGPSWIETDIDDPRNQQTYSTSLSLPDLVDNITEQEFQRISTIPQEDKTNNHQKQLCSLNNKLSNKPTSNTQCHSQLQSTIKSSRGAETFTPDCAGTRNANERVGLYTSDVTSFPLTGLTGNWQSSYNQQEEQANIISSDCHAQSQDKHTQNDCPEYHSRLSQYWPTDTQSEYTQCFFSEPKDAEYQMIQNEGKSPDHKSPVASTNIHSDFQSSLSLLPSDVLTAQTKPSAPESSCRPQPVDTCSTTQGSEDLAKTSPQPPKRSPLKSSRSPIKALESPASPTESSSSSSSSSASTSNAQSLIDVDHLLSSGITVAGFKPRPIIRKRQKVMTPTAQKDGSYWHKRKKNNDSAKRSREAKKEKEKNFYRRALELEYENYFLRERLGQMEAQLQAVTGSIPAPQQPPPPPHLPPHGHTGAASVTVPLASADYGSG